MEYAEGFKDLPLDSTELVTDCRMAAFHLGSNIQQCSMLHIFKQSQFKQLTKKKTGLHCGAAQTAFTIHGSGLTKCCVWTGNMK